MSVLMTLNFPKRSEAAHTHTHTTCVIVSRGRCSLQSAVINLDRESALLLPLRDFLFHLPAENHSAPPDVTGYSSDSPHSHTERHHMANMGTIARNTQKYGNAERMETGDGEG